MIFQHHVPGPPLSDFIEMMWFGDDYIVPYRLERVLPTGDISLIINLYEDRTRVYDPNNPSKFQTLGGAILVGILVITLAGIPLGLSHWPAHFFSWPNPSGTLFKLDLRGAAKIGLGELIFVFFFVDLFDNVGTLVGVCEQGGFLRDGKLPRASRALLADAIGTLFGALSGTSTVTSYIESASGVAAGARTGLGNVVIAALFFAAMFCAPLVAAIPSYATAPALVFVGALMCGAVARVNWDDFSEAVPAFLTLVATPLTFSIATGLSMGLLTYTFMKVGTGRYREISPLIWILSALFLLRYAFLGSE